MHAVHYSYDLSGANANCKHTNGSARLAKYTKEIIDTGFELIIHSILNDSNEIRKFGAICKKE